MTGGQTHTNRERVERTLLSTTAAATSLEPRTAVRGPAHSDSGFYRQKLSPHLSPHRTSIAALSLEVDLAATKNIRIP